MALADLLQRLPALGDVKRELARRQLARFTAYTFPQYVPNWHNQLLCQYLDRFVAGDIKRLMVFMPPRHGKSELVSRRLPAYILGRYPDSQIIACSYSADLSQRMNLDVQRIMEHEKYLELFPESHLGWSSGHRRAIRSSECFEVQGRRGMYRSAGVGGGITGMGFNYGIIDDPIKNREEANSATIRSKMWEWYTDVFYTRAEKQAGILFTMTRWHHFDLAGMLLSGNEEMPESDQWTVLSLPARREPVAHPEDPRAEDEPLWPWKYSSEALSVIQQQLGAYSWAALYQQRPAPISGGMFKAEWFRTFKEEAHHYVLAKRQGDDVVEVRIPKMSCRRFTTTDLAASLRTTADYTVISTWALTPTYDLLWLDMRRFRLEGPDQIPALWEVHKAWHPLCHGIEKAGYQLAMIQAARRKGLPVVEVKVDKDKMARAVPAAARMEGGQVFFRAGAAWRPVAEDELLQFPNGEHDDIVDTLSAADFMIVHGKLGMTACPSIVEKTSHFQGALRP